MQADYSEPTMEWFENIDERVFEKFPIYGSCIQMDEDVHGEIDGYQEFHHPLTIDQNILLSFKWESNTYGNANSYCKNVIDRYLIETPETI